uniref:Uracil-DNA glycosylase n=2 Tax=Arion vulgaris TaxID=1028688 RepID=A0A0B7BAH3_9EUPU
MKLLSSKTNGLVVNIGPSWFTALEQEFSKEYFSQLSQFIAAERKNSTVYPPADQVFTWTTACALRSVKVVIIGQDPYHGPRQAHGLCFSVLPGVTSPPSLGNMFKELESDIAGFKIPNHGLLSGWAQQGVLLLNACLTVRSGQPNSHAGKGWEKLTDAVIQWLNSNLQGLVFLLWGAYAQKKGACINKKKHHVLTAVHPSPLSAHRGFLGCKHFSRCNELLIADGQVPIDWKHLPEKVDL